MLINIFSYFSSQLFNPPNTPEIIIPIGKWVVTLGICIAKIILKFFYHHLRPHNSKIVLSYMEQHKAAPYYFYIFK